MFTSRFRVALFVGSLTLVGLGGLTSQASAIPSITGSQITSPADPTSPFFEEGVDTSATVAFTVKGTVTGATSGEIDLLCYYGVGGDESTILAEKAPVSEGMFSVPVKFEKLTPQPCVMRAVPTGDSAPQSASSPFEGPRIALSSFESSSLPSLLYDYELNAYTPFAGLRIDSVGDCGLESSDLFAPESLTAGTGTFDCNGALYANEIPASGEATRSELRIDGANAYTPDAALDGPKLEAKNTGAGIEPLSVSKSFDPATGLARISEVDPIVECAPKTTYPPTEVSCTHFVSSGVELERTWETSDADKVAWMTDVWRSTDGQAHILDALYDQETINAGSGGAFDFGEGEFLPLGRGEAVTLPASSPGAMFFKTDASTPNTGDGEHPLGAIVYDKAPSRALRIYRGSDESGYNGFQMPYLGQVTASGTATLRMAFVQAYSLSEVRALAEEAGEIYSERLEEETPPTSAGPIITITTPGNGSVVTEPVLTVTGTVIDSVGVTLTVAGKVVPVAPDGSWAAKLALSPGLNVIGVVAKDEEGLSSTKSIKVTYSPPSPPPPAPPILHATAVGNASAGKGSVSFTITCEGAAGANCEIAASLTTTEKSKGGKPIAVSAKKHRAKTISKEVSVGSSKTTTSVGQKIEITLNLNALGKRLLAKFGKLPVHLSATLVSNGANTSILSQTLTLKAPKSKHKGKGKGKRKKHKR